MAAGFCNVGKRKMSDRKFSPTRYRQKPGFCLDHDGSKYINQFGVLDGDRNTGITVTDSGDNNVPNSNKRTISYKDRTFPLIRDAIFAYEDDLAIAEQMPTN